MNEAGRRRLTFGVGVIWFFFLLLFFLLFLFLEGCFLAKACIHTLLRVC